MLARRIVHARLISSCAAAALLGGCAATPLQPTIEAMPGPGKTAEAFQADNAVCKTFAADQIKAPAGGVAAVGAARSVNDPGGIQSRYDSEFSRCMYAKGEQVPGYVPATARGAAAIVAKSDRTVRATQSELIRLGYLSGSADGFAGPKTHSAITRFELANGLSPDGKPSSRLLARLRATRAASTAAGAAAPNGWVSPTAPPAATRVSAPPPAEPPDWVEPAKSP